MIIYLATSQPMWICHLVHNITNISDEDLYTIFWINEF